MVHGIGCLYAAGENVIGGVMHERGVGRGALLRECGEGVGIDALGGGFVCFRAVHVRPCSAIDDELAARVDADGIGLCEVEGGQIGRFVSKHAVIEQLLPCAPEHAVGAEEQDGRM